MIVSKIEIKLQFPYVVQAQYEHHTAADAHLQYYCVQWKPDITGMVGPEQKSCYSRSLLHPKSREKRTD